MRRSAPSGVLCFLAILLPFLLGAQQLDTALIKRLDEEAKQAFHSGNFEKNVIMTDSLAEAYANGGNFERYAIFSMFNGWTHLNELKDYERAHFYALRALSTVQEKLNGSLPYLDDLYGLLAGIYTNTGNPEKALEYNFLALQTVEEQGKENTFSDYVANSNLGTGFMGLQQWAEALPFLYKARDILLGLAKKKGWEQRLYFSASQLQAHISNCLMELNEPEQALDEANAGLVYTQEGGRPDHFGYQDIYLALANAHSVNGQFREADEYFQLLEKMYADFFGPQSTQMAMLFMHRSDHANRQNTPAEALRLNTIALQQAGIHLAGDQLSLVRQSANIRCQSCEPALFRQRARLLWQLARSEENKKAYLEACLAVAELAVESMAEARKSILFREGSKQILFQKYRSILKVGALAAQELFQLDGGRQYLEQAFELAEQSKANVLLEALVGSRAEAFAGLPAEVLEKERLLALELVRQEKFLEDALNDRDTIKAGRIRSGPLFESRQQYELFLKQLEKGHPGYFAARHQTPTVSLASLQKALPPNALFISYLLSEEENCLLAYAVSNGHAELKKISWKPEYEEQIGQLYRSLQQASLIQDRKRLAFIRQSHELYQLFVQPIEHLLDGKSRLIIAADGVIHYLPFEALLPKEEDASFSGLDFLIRKAAVSYHYSGAAFLESVKKQAPETTTLLAFAPVFQENDEMASLNIRARYELEPNLRAVKDGRFTPLPWSAKEVEAIAALFGEGNYTLFLRQEAGEAALKEGMESEFRYLHVASHSFANRKNPGFSGIACYRTEQDEEDGILFTNEIYQQRARADLAVLSSCESGVGNLASGEGMLGLNRSFIYAGVPNVLYSLWKVDDQRSSELMVEFYKAVLAGKPYPEALQQAKLHLLNQPATALPLYWSAFTLIGR